MWMCSITSMLLTIIRCGCPHRETVSCQGRRNTREGVTVAFVEIKSQVQRAFQVLASALQWLHVCFMCAVTCNAETNSLAEAHP